MPRKRSDTVYKKKIAARNQESDIEEAETIIDEEEDNMIPLNIPLEYQNINVEKRDFTIRELWNRYANRNLILEPDFQRHYVWDDKRASRFVESLILGLPTPPIFIAEESTGQWTVIDGHQRLASLFRFMRPLVSHVAKVAGVEVPWANLAPLVLVNLEIKKELNGQPVTSIKSSDRDTLLWQAKIPVVKLDKDANEGMKYALFARLNQGSLSLNNQELRNCLYRGSYNVLISQLSDTSRYLNLWKKSSSDRRMRDRERVLRFFAFLHRMNEYASPLREFLNKEMKWYQDADPQQIVQFRSEFIDALTWVEQLLGDKAFKQYKIGDENKHEGHWVRNRYDLIYDVEMVGFGEFNRQLTETWGHASSYEKDLFKRLMLNRLVSVMTTETFVASINEGTMRVSAVKARFDPWFHELDLLVKDFSDTLDEAKTLFEVRQQNQNICGYCRNHVSEEEAVLTNVNGIQNIAHIYCYKSKHKR